MVVVVVSRQVQKGTSMSDEARKKKKEVIYEEMEVEKRKKS